MHLFGVGHTDEIEEDFMGSFSLTEVVLVVRFLESRFRVANSSKDMLTVDIRFPYSLISIRNLEKCLKPAWNMNTKSPTHFTSHNIFVTSPQQI